MYFKRSLMKKNSSVAIYILPTHQRNSVEIRSSSDLVLFTDIRITIFSKQLCTVEIIDTRSR